MKALPFLIQTEGGAALPFCDFACFHTFVGYADIGEVASGKRLKSRKDLCFHCGGCGRRIFKNTSCPVHEGECPDWLWYGCLPTITDFLDYYEIEKGNRLPSQAFWSAAEEVARVHPGLAGEDLAALTIKLVELLDEDDREQ
jgi:hypothetical protein